MRKHLWKAVALAAVLVMTVSVLTALAQEKKAKPAPAPKASEQAMPGCGMKGGAAREMPGCSMKGGMAKEMAGCGMKGGMGKGMGDCCEGGGMRGGMTGCCMTGGMGKGMPGCGMKGGMGMAGGAMCGPGMGAGQGAMMLEGLGLTAEQQKKVQELHERQARQQIQAGADLQLATMDLQKLMRADAPDKAKIDAQIDKVAQLRAQMQKSHMATMLEVRAMLTPEQLKMWQAGPMGAGEESD